MLSSQKKWVYWHVDVPIVYMSIPENINSQKSSKKLLLAETAT